jgi:hypothetical protein
VDVVKIVTRKRQGYLFKYIIILCLLFLTSCAFFNKKSIDEGESAVTSIGSDNESTKMLGKTFSLKDPVFRIDIESQLLSKPIVQESFAEWINNFKTDFSKILEEKNIYDPNNYRSYIIPELHVQPKAKELLDCDTFIPYLYKRCEKKYFVYINGYLFLHFYDDDMPIKHISIDFTRLGIPNIAETSNIEDINKKAVYLMGEIYKHLIIYLTKNNNIYYIDKRKGEYR